MQHGRQSAPSMRLRCARDTRSKLRAHTTGIPSSGESTTSVDNPRIVRVTGATMTLFKRSTTSSRVRIRTGRRLSGALNVYHRISPRFNRRPPNLQSPTLTVHRRTRIPHLGEVARGRLPDRLQRVVHRSVEAGVGVLGLIGNRSGERHLRRLTTSAWKVFYQNARAR
jgi:hypothetical protein